MTEDGILVTQKITPISKLENGNYSFVTPMTAPAYLQRMSDIKNVGDIFFTDDEKALFEDIIKMVKPSVKELMEKLNKTFKFNYLFYGTQGGGKGVFTQKVINYLAENWEGPVLVFNQHIAKSLQIDRFLRTHFGSDNNILTIYVEDECERRIYEAKEILDSAISPGNMVTFWITNKINDLDETIYVERPSRMALSHEFEHLTKSEAKAFVRFLFKQFEEKKLLDHLEGIEFDDIAGKFNDKSKDYISNELMMSMIHEKIKIDAENEAKANE